MERWEASLYEHACERTHASHEPGAVGYDIDRDDLLSALGRLTPHAPVRVNRRYEIHPYPASARVELYDSLDRMHLGGFHYPPVDPTLPWHDYLLGLARVYADSRYQGPNTPPCRTAGGQRLRRRETTKP